MANQRRQIAMTETEVTAFLSERRNATFCTLNRDGSIHAVAMWYGFLDGRLAVHTKAKSQKAKNLGRDPRLTCLVETGERYEELRGVELVGTGVLVDDPDEVYAVGVSVFDRYVSPYTDEARGSVEAILRKRVAFVLDVHRVVSWDHRKLGT